MFKESSEKENSRSRSREKSYDRSSRSESCEKHRSRSRKHSRENKSKHDKHDKKIQDDFYQLVHNFLEKTSKSCEPIKKKQTSLKFDVPCGHEKCQIVFKQRELMRQQRKNEKKFNCCCGDKHKCKCQCKCQCRHKQSKCKCPHRHVHKHHKHKKTHKHHSDEEFPDGHCTPKVSDAESHDDSIESCDESEKQPKQKETPQKPKHHHKKEINPPIVWRYETVLDQQCIPVEADTSPNESDQHELNSQFGKMDDFGPVLRWD